MNYQRIHILLSIGIAVIIGMCIWMISDIQPRIYLSIDSFDLQIGRNAHHPINIGKNSDICFHKIPKDYLSVYYNDTTKAFEWQINNEYKKKDSLFYYKVNNTNPNKHAISQGDTLKVVGITLTKEEIDKLLSGQESQYVLLRNVLAKKQEVDSTFNPQTDYKTDKRIKSFLYRDKDSGVLSFGKKLKEWQIVILDNKTKLHSDNKVIGYAYKGSTKDYEIRDSFKIQFFRVADYSYKAEKTDTLLFSIAEVNYQLKPVLNLTEWGAGHVTLSLKDKGVKANLPKPVTYVESLDKLRSVAQKNSGVVTIQQFYGSFPISGNLFLPQFSTALRQDVVSLNFYNDSIFCDKDLLETSHPLLPSFKCATDKDLNGKNLRIGIINTGFLCSYLWLPLFILILLVLFYTYFMNVNINEQNRYKLGFRSNQTATYSVCLFLIAFAYFLCKIMIAIKLSYTYPYFEKITGIIVVSTSLMLLLIYHTALVFNHDYLTFSSSKKSANRRKWLAFGIGLLGLVICISTMYRMDHDFNQAALNSYFSEELFTFKVWKWPELNGMNDLHRNVPCTLFFMNFVVLTVLFIKNCWSYIKDKSYIKKCKAHLNKLHLSMEPGNQATGWKSILAKWCMPLFYSWPAIVVLICSLIPGNFSTAFITLAMVFGFTYTISHVVFSNGFLFAIYWMFLATIIYIAAATSFGDMGYFTNLVGLVLFCIICYFVFRKTGDITNSEDLNNREREKKWLPRIFPGIIVICAILIYAAPLFIHTEDVSYNRMNRRVNMFLQFDEYRDSGYRYANSDTEFMIVMNHYMQNSDGTDPLSNQKHMLHPSISTGQSPVILNDVSLQSSFLGAYGIRAYIVYGGLLLIMLILVFCNFLNVPQNSDTENVNKKNLWQILAALMWFGTTYYLFLSYHGVLPFTGRLNPGFGVDSAGEALETSLLLSFMLASGLYSSDQK